MPELAFKNLLSLVKSKSTHASHWLIDVLASRNERQIKKKGSGCQKMPRNTLLFERSEQMCTGLANRRASDVGNSKQFAGWLAHVNIAQQTITKIRDNAIPCNVVLAYQEL